MTPCDFQLVKQKVPIKEKKTEVRDKKFVNLLSEKEKEGDRKLPKKGISSLLILAWEGKGDDS